MDEPRAPAARLLDGDDYELLSHGWLVLYRADDTTSTVVIAAFTKAVLN